MTLKALVKEAPQRKEDQQIANHAPLVILRLPEVKRRTGLGRSTVYLRIKQGLLPPPRPLGGRAVGWVEGELNAALEKMICADREAHHG